ncbi:MAG: hypothetical protein U9O94_02800, partial [Nanoarchaeota archaeon]|nr:hypothetical protein [Nanoarchaeota archaeon]
GEPLVVYHGTTHEFFEFTKDRAHVENDFGKGHYFTSSEDDALSNYAGEQGQDLTNRVERRAEQIESEDEISFEDAKQIAKEELVGGAQIAEPVFLSFKNPIILKEKGGTYLEVAPDMEYYKDIAKDEIDKEDYDKEDYNEALEEKARDIYYEDYDPVTVGNASKLLDAVDTVSREFDVDFSLTKMEIFLEEGVSAKEFVDGLKEFDELAYLQDSETGDLAGNEFVRRVFEEAGFDGIIDKTVYNKWGAGRGFSANVMGGIYQDTAHYVAFQPTQIKSIYNKGTFDPTNPDIRYRSLTDAIPKTKTEKRPKTQSAYEQKKDDWFGNKDWENQKADIEAKEFEDRIKETTPKKNWKQVNEAIHVYLDMKRNPSHIKKFYDKLTDEQKNIVDIAKNLTSEQKKIAEDISKSYEKVGLKALGEGVIQNILDNYVARAWKMEDKPSTQFWNKFSTKSRHSKKRVLETILEGWANGLELEIKGATANLYTLKTEINNVVEDKKLLKEGKKIKDREGNSLFSNKKLGGYKEIDHPNFKEWKFIGNIGEELTKKQAETYTGDVFITPDGVVLQRKPLYAPIDVANNLNNILGRSKLKGIKAIDIMTKYNAIIKAWILQTSLFHHFAFGRSFIFGGALNRMKQANIKYSYRKGLKAIQEMQPEVELLVRNGLTLGKMQDWNEEILKQETFIDKIADKYKATKKIKDTIKTFREDQAKFLFNKYGAGIKAMAGMLEYKKQLKENPEMSPNERAKIVADLINDDFGGLHLGRMGRNPTVQHIFRLFALAPDWTESNVRSMIKAIHSGTKAETKMYRKFWSRIALRGLMLTTAVNFLMALIDKDEPDEEYVETVARRYKEAWDKGYLKWLDADITPVYRALGGKKDKAYFPVIGHFKDPIKFVVNPARSAHHKGSVVYRLIHEAIVGENWQKRPFTEWDELIGLDTEHWSPSYKGEYKTTREGKYKDGDTKGGKLKGQFTKWDFKGGKPVDYSTLPSYLLHEVRSTQPVQVQNFISWLNGEVDWFQAIGSSSGLGITTSDIYNKDGTIKESYKRKTRTKRKRKTR